MASVGATSRTGGVSGGNTSRFHYHELLAPKEPFDVRATARRAVYSVLPILTWLPQYKLKEYLLLDLLTGITVALTLIPQGLAYAAIAGIDVTYGLYASLFPAVLYTFFGTSKDLSVGPSPIMASLMARCFLDAGPDEDVTGKVIAISFYTGLLQIALYLLQAGFVLELLSNPIISGFTSGAALSIAMGQVDSLLGFKIEYSRSFLINIIKIAPEFGRTNPWALLVGAIIMIFLEVFKRYDKTIGWQYVSRDSRLPTSQIQGVWSLPQVLSALCLWHCHEHPLYVAGMRSCCCSL